jgi:hypothetical protein
VRVLGCLQHDVSLVYGSDVRGDVLPSRYREKERILYVQVACVISAKLITTPREPVAL